VSSSSRNDSTYLSLGLQRLLLELPPRRTLLAARESAHLGSVLERFFDGLPRRSDCLDDDRKIDSVLDR
jgi:hypothetical protein